MTAANATIVTSYEVLELSVEDIAAQEGLEVESVKAILAGHSSLYRERLRSDSATEDISNGEFEDIKSAMKQIALYGEQEGVRLKALRFLWDEKKGRNEIKKDEGARNLRVNVLIFNQQLKKIREVRSKVRDTQTPQILDAEVVNA